MLMRTPAPWVRPKRLQPPGFIVPCQPTLAHKVPVGDGWIHELKHDGFRILAFKDGDTVRLWSRNGRNWSAEFVAITEAMRGLPFKRIMLDGEAVAHCLEGMPHFHKLLGDGQATACLYAFDLLWLEAQDVRGALNRAYNGLTSGMDVDVLDRDLLLALAAMAAQRTQSLV